jgi:hypothetical protein
MAVGRAMIGNCGWPEACASDAVYKHLVMDWELQLKSCRVAKLGGARPKPICARPKVPHNAASHPILPTATLLHTIRRLYFYPLVEHPIGGLRRGGENPHSSLS